MLILGGFRFLVWWLVLILLKKFLGIVLVIVLFLVEGGVGFVGCIVLFSNVWIIGFWKVGELFVVWILFVFLKYIIVNIFLLDYCLFLNLFFCCLYYVIYFFDN